MVELVTFQIVRDFVAIFGVIVGLTYYVLNVRNSQKMQRMQLETRRTQIKLKFYNAFKPEFLNQIVSTIYLKEFSNLREYYDKYGPKVDPEGHTSMMSLVYIYNSIGTFLREGDID